MRSKVVRFSLAERARVVMCSRTMRETRLFVLGHLTLLAIAVIGSL